MITAEELANAIVRDVAELPDRNSPEGWPEAMIVTADELRLIVQSRAAGVRGAGDAETIAAEMEAWADNQNWPRHQHDRVDIRNLAKRVRRLATPQPPNTIRVDVEQIGSCELDVRDGVAYMPGVTVQDIVSKSCLKPQPPKDAGAVPIPDRPALPLRINRETLTAPGKWTTQEAEVIRAYGNAREAAGLAASDAQAQTDGVLIKALTERNQELEREPAGRADAVPVSVDDAIRRAPDALAAFNAALVPSLRLPETVTMRLAMADALLSIAAEPAARAQAAVGEPAIDAIYNWCATRGLFGDGADEVTDDDIVAALDDYEGALIEAAELAVNQLPKSVRLYSEKELEACESSASAVARAKAFDEVREMCAPLGYESFREAFDALGKLQASPAHTGAGAEALRLDVAEEPKA